MSCERLSQFSLSLTHYTLQDETVPIARPGPVGENFVGASFACDAMPIRDPDVHRLLRLVHGKFGVV